MKFIVAAAFVGSAIAATAPMMTGTAAPVYTTVTSTAYTTYCPQPTSFEFNGETYTVTEATTLTITDCPDNSCTWVQPVITTSSVACGGDNCGSPSGYNNYTVPHPSSAAPTGCNGYSCNPNPGPDDTPEEPVTAAAGKVAALSGAALAGVLALAAAL